MKSKKIAMYGLLIALTFILSYIESQFTIPVAIPGIKLGLANLVVITALYLFGKKEAFIVSVIRIILVGFTFGSPYTIMYSLAGGILSWLIMSLFKSRKIFSITGVSILGGISHNIGQIAAAVLYVEDLYIIYYLPFLLISGVITGAIIGILGTIIISRLKNYIRIE